MDSFGDSDRYRMKKKANQTLLRTPSVMSRAGALHVMVAGFILWRQCRWQNIALLCRCSGNARRMSDRPNANEW